MTGYYNPRWLLKNIFDMNQADLENATEKLSDMLECEDIMKWCNEDERVDMINQTNQVHGMPDCSPRDACSCACRCMYLQLISPLMLSMHARDTRESDSDHGEGAGEDAAQAPAQCVRIVENQP